SHHAGGHPPRLRRVLADARPVAESAAVEIFGLSSFLLEIEGSTMRALCGAIIAAGAMIGLGLTAVGFGVRYAMMDKVNPDTHAQIGATSLTILLTVLGCGLAVG